MTYIDASDAKILTLRNKEEISIDDIFDRIQSRASQGYWNTFIDNLSEVHVSRLEKAGFKVDNYISNSFEISWK
jgi:hypothetical protein